MIHADTIVVRLKARTVLDGISMEAAAGRVTVLVGPNGAGKSTLLKALAGLVALQSGVVRLNSQPIRDIALPERARVLAYLPQDREVHWPLPVRGIVALGRLPYELAGLRDADNDQNVIADAMRVMDVAHLAERSVLELSGGERARVLMARALAQTPRYLLADEPTAGLDLAHQLLLFQHLRDVAARGIVVVVALHDLSLAARFADHVVVIKSGQIAASGPPSHVLTAERMGPVYGVRMLEGRVGDVPVLLPDAVLP
jgi:iron complex transport system ATP-binding protein